MLCHLAGVVDVCLIPEVGFELEGERGLFAYIANVLEHRGHAVICLAEGAGQVRQGHVSGKPYSLPSFLPALRCQREHDVALCDSSGKQKGCFGGEFCERGVHCVLHVHCDPPFGSCLFWRAQDILAQGHQERDASGNPILKDVGLWMRNELKSHFKEADIKYIDPSYMIRSTPTISADRIYCKVGYGRLALLLMLPAPPIPFLLYSSPSLHDLPRCTSPSLVIRRTLLHAAYAGRHCCQEA